MAHRFGATPAHTYATKVRWLVGCLLSLIGLLITAFVIVAQTRTAQGAAIGLSQSTPDPRITPPTVVELLVTKVRIEEGVRLSSQMFEFASVEPGDVPLGAIRKQDLEQVMGKYSSKLIAPNSPLLLEAISDRRPERQINIPPGYRAVTITVDSRSGIEGFATPSKRVDVLWSFSQDGQQKLATIVRFTKVLSVDGATETNQERAQVSGSRATTVTLLVSEKDAKKIELARVMGALSLTLVSDQEESKVETDPGTISIAELLNPDGREDVERETEIYDGTAYTTDDRTGRPLKYKHRRSGQWVVDSAYMGEG